MNFKGSVPRLLVNLIITFLPTGENGRSSSSYSPVKKKNSHHPFSLWEIAAIPESFPTASLFWYLYSVLYETKNVIGFFLSMNSWGTGGPQHHIIFIKSHKWLIMFSECSYTVSLLSMHLNSYMFAIIFFRRKYVL